MFKTLFRKGEMNMENHVLEDLELMGELTKLAIEIMAKADGAKRLDAKLRYKHMCDMIAALGDQAASISCKIEAELNK